MAETGNKEKQAVVVTRSSLLPLLAGLGGGAAAATLDVLRPHREAVLIRVYRLVG